jgi:hypothetical protein
VMVALGEPGTPLICCAPAAAVNRKVSVNVATANRRRLMTNSPFSKIHGAAFSKMAGGLPGILDLDQ